MEERDLDLWRGMSAAAPPADLRQAAEAVATMVLGAGAGPGGDDQGAARAVPRSAGAVAAAHYRFLERADAVLRHLGVPDTAARSRAATDFADGLIFHALTSRRAEPLDRSRSWRRCCAFWARPEGLPHRAPVARRESHIDAFPQVDGSNRDLLRLAFVPRTPLRHVPSVPCCMVLGASHHDLELTHLERLSADADGLWAALVDLCRRPESPVAGRRAAGHLQSAGDLCRRIRFHDAIDAITGCFRPDVGRAGRGRVRAC